MVFTSPLMLLGLLALPALAAVYWLRSRSQRAVVSSLAFWTDQRRPAAAAGRFIACRRRSPSSWNCWRSPLLVVAAAGPGVTKTDVVRPLVVVLDDSYSMLAPARTPMRRIPPVGGRRRPWPKNYGAIITSRDSSWPAHNPVSSASPCASRPAPTRFFANGLAKAPRPTWRRRWPGPRKWEAQWQESSCSAITRRWPRLAAARFSGGLSAASCPTWHLRRPPAAESAKMNACFWRWPICRTRAAQAH